MVNMIIILIVNIVDMDMIVLIVNVVDTYMIIWLADSQYGGNGYGQTCSQYGRYGHIIIKLIINIVEMNVIIELMISMADMEVIKQIMNDIGSIDASVVIKGTIFMAMVATYIVNTSGEIIRATLTHSSQNKFSGRGGMNVYNADVIHFDDIPYDACFKGMYSHTSIYMMLSIYLTL